MFNIACSETKKKRSLYSIVHYSLGIRRLYALKFGNGRQFNKLLYI